MMNTANDSESSPGCRAPGTGDVGRAVTILLLLLSLGWTTGMSCAITMCVHQPRVSGRAAPMRFSHQDSPSEDASGKHRCRSSPCASDGRVPPVRSLRRGAETEVPDDPLQP